MCSTQFFLTWIVDIWYRKLQEWDDEDGFGPAKADDDHVQDMSKNSRVVVLKHMFTLEDLEKDASLLLDLKEDVREECSTLGEVTNVVLYDVGVLCPSVFLVNLQFYQKEKDGIMTVKFKDPISAQACVVVCLLYLNHREISGFHRFLRK